MKADAHHIAAQLGQAMASHQRGELAQAEALYKSILAANPHHFEALHFLGLIEAQRNRFEEADRLMRASLEVNAGTAEAFANHARVLNALKRSQEALAACERALAINPRSLETLVSRGNAFKDLGQYEQALASYEEALAVRPDYLVALTNRGAALLRLRRGDEALASLDRALSIRPEDPDALNVRGMVLRELNQFTAALASFDAALAARPEHPQALYNRALVLQELKRFNEALATYDRARAIKPDHPAAYGYLDAAAAICDWRRTACVASELADRAEAGINPLGLLALVDDPAFHLRCAMRCIEERMPAQSRSSWKRAPFGHDRIRIAYCSPDFRDHPVARLIVELIERHDRAHFEVIGVAFDRDDSDLQRRLAKAFDQVHDARAMGDRGVASLLAGLEVDIAVDLAGYTHGCRPEVFGHRAAPIQVNYLYAGTTGADFFDYIIADKIVAPFEHKRFFSEKIVHLPDCYLAHYSQRAAAERTPTRRELGLPEAGFVFCCFNNNFKLTEPIFDVWMRLLRAVPGSVLWLLRDNDDAAANLRGAAQSRGVDAARLVFAGRAPNDEHLARHRVADLFLDTLPYNAHATASDALWMGLPVLTCQGRALAGRVAASLLHAIGLPELVTVRLADYEALALRIATEPALLVAARTKLARNRQTHPLFDIDRFRRHIEAAYTRMWKIFERGEPPQSFSVRPLAS